MLYSNFTFMIQSVQHVKITIFQMQWIICEHNFFMDNVKRWELLFESANHDFEKRMN